MHDVYAKVFDLVNSSDVQAKLAGILAIGTVGIACDVCVFFFWEGLFSSLLFSLVLILLYPLLRFYVFCFNFYCAYI